MKDSIQKCEVYTEKDVCADKWLQNWLSRLKR